MDQWTQFKLRHNQLFERALSELKNGQKKSHWIWFIFPQLEGLGQSSIARQFALECPEDAVDFLEQPGLGSNYLEAVSVLAKQSQSGPQPLRDIFGALDRLKVCSSLTLFEWASTQIRGPKSALLNTLCQDIFRLCPDAKRCAFTLQKVSELN